MAVAVLELGPLAEGAGAALWGGLQSIATIEGVSQAVERVTGANRDPLPDLNAAIQAAVDAANAARDAAEGSGSGLSSCCDRLEQRIIDVGQYIVYHDQRFQTVAADPDHPGEFIQLRSILGQATSAAMFAEAASDGATAVRSLLEAMNRQIGFYSLDAAGVAAFQQDVAGGRTTGSGLVVLRQDEETGGWVPSLNPSLLTYSSPSGVNVWPLFELFIGILNGLEIYPRNV